MKIMIRFKKLLLVLAGMMFVWAITSFIEPQVSQSYTNAYTVKPIANKMTLITSAGQSTDTYIIQDIANELRLNNLFMPGATSVDIEDISSMIIVTGYSETGIKLNDRDFNEECERVNQLMINAREANLPIIVIYLGGRARRNEMTDRLLELTSTGADYIITTNYGNFDQMITELCHNNLTQIFVIENISDLNKPLASIFR